MSVSRTIRYLLLSVCVVATMSVGTLLWVSIVGTPTARGGNYDKSLRCTWTLAESYALRHYEIDPNGYLRYSISGDLPLLGDLFNTNTIVGWNSGEMPRRWGSIFASNARSHQGRGLWGQTGMSPLWPIGSVGYEIDRTATLPILFRIKTVDLDFVAIVCTVGVVWIGLLGLAKVIDEVRSRGRVARGCCRTCGYQLSAVQVTCPECGGSNEVARVG